jgi:hypothetical protein
MMDNATIEIEKKVSVVDLANLKIRDLSPRIAAKVPSNIDCPLMGSSGCCADGSDPLAMELAKKRLRN